MSDSPDQPQYAPAYVRWLEANLAEAIAELEDIVHYVPDYFRTKWGYDETIAKLSRPYEPEDISSPGGVGNTPKHRAILNALREHGPIEDMNGRAVRILLDRAGTHGSTQALSAALKDLDEAGLIERTINVRRTYRIALTDKAAKAA